MLPQEVTAGPSLLERDFDLLEAALPYNCEHVVPQSRFGNREPMRGDLHHLFALRKRVQQLPRQRPLCRLPRLRGKGSARLRLVGRTRGSNPSPERGQSCGPPCTFWCAPPASLETAATSSPLRA
ncbi:endonuclease [Saccharopolyspora sp. NPDC002376]